MIAVRGTFQRDTSAELVYRDAGLSVKKGEYHFPGHEISFVFLTGTAELNRKEPAAACVFEKP